MNKIMFNDKYGLTQAVLEGLTGGFLNKKENWI